MSDRVFYSICFGFFAGVLLASFIYLPIYIVLFVSVITLALLLFYSTISKNAWGVIFSVFLLVCSFGVLRFQMVPQTAPTVFESHVNQKVSLTGIVIDEPTVREKNMALTVEVVEGTDTTDVLVSTNFGKDFFYGDEVHITGVLKKPENFKGDNGKEFDYVNYLKKDGIFYVMGYPTIDIVSQGHGSKVKSILFLAKEKFVDTINFAVPEPESLLMGGLILGEKSAFDTELRQSFVNTGTIHIIALSGYNITIVAEWFMKLFAFLPLTIGIAMGIVSILLFIIMTGGSSTALRAGIMATLALVARATGRTYDIARALVLAGVLMILVNPLLLVYDVSFQLSFIATVAVIFLQPRIKKYFMWVTPRFELRDIVSITCAAYIFVLPFILYKMGNLSLVALPANVLILPFIPLTMIFGFVTGFIGLLSQTLALPFGFASYWLLHYELGVIGFLSHIPFASLSIPNFPLFLTIIIYLYFVYRLFGRNIALFFKGL